MTKRMPTPKTGSRLFELTSHILETKPVGVGVTSAEIVDQIMLEKDSLPDPELDEVLRVGFMVLAGRVPLMNRSDPNQLDILAKHGLPRFVDLRLPNGKGGYKTRRYDVAKLTPDIIVKHKSVGSRQNVKSKKDNLLDWAEERIAAGLGGISVEKS